MSGGVDSSVTAAWLKTMGYEVIGISLQVHDMSASVTNTFGTCCSLSDISDARRIAEMMHFPFYVANMEKEFEAYVIDDFVEQYLRGRTPNPCVRCNEKVKFRRLLDWALDLGADYLATGHYAGVRFNDETAEYELTRGLDPARDQSYFLFVIHQADLRHVFFPVGEFTKDQVRDLARKLGLPVAEKQDSQEICFVQDRRYQAFLEQRVPESLRLPGNIVDSRGVTLGQHGGVHHFTIGQRKGLNLSSKVPLFVTDIRPASREVVVGPENNLYRSSCVVSSLNWINPPNLHHPPEVTAKIRYRAQDTKAKISPLLDNRIEVQFESSVKSITPGQAVVFYQGDRCLGGGWIDDFPRD